LNISILEKIIIEGAGTLSKIEKVQIININRIKQGTNDK
jgi:hypothetical protein